MTSAIPHALRVLVVEDEFAIAAYIEELLQDFKCFVVGPAATLAHALALAAEQSIDAALLDVRLGKERSTSVADLLTERRIPFVLMTGYDGPVEGFAPCATLLKPFGAKGLEQAIRACVG